MATLKLVNIDGVALTEDFYSLKEELEKLEVRNEDVWVTAFPKSCCTWTQEMVWLLGNNLDYEGAKVTIGPRFPFVDFDAMKTEVCKFIKDNNIQNDFPSVSPNYMNIVKQIKGTRFIKTHLPCDFLPKQVKNGTKTPKIIHVMRNPKQIVPSYYHHSTAVFSLYVGSLNDFIDLFIKGKLIYGDYFRTVLSYWNERHRSNILILTYEEMHSDLLGVIKKVSKFLGKSYDEDELKKLALHLSFDQMKQNPAVNMQRYVQDDKRQFMRKGTIDSYKEELSPEMINKLDEWINEKIKGTGLPYEN